MDNIRRYHIHPALRDPPAVNVVVGKTGTEIESSSPYEQQRLASQRPRGTKVDPTGTRIQVKGARNYTSRNLYISREEMFDDVVMRGLRADGLSTKLGVKNNKDAIGKLITELFEGDSRLQVIEDNFKRQRQKSNSAKTMFATMAHEELQFLKQETFPSRIDVQIRECLLDVFAGHPEKLQSAVEVLKQIQQIFKAVTPQVNFLSNHNFQTRGFFLDIILMTCSFLMQIIQDSEQGDASSSQDQQCNEMLGEQQFSNEESVLKENKRAAEILLSVGSDVVDKSSQPSNGKSGIRQAPKKEKSQQKVLPTTIVVEEENTDYKATDEWTTVEMLDTSGNARYVLIKSNNEDSASMDSSKILHILQNQGITWDDKIVSFNNTQISSVQGVLDDKQSSDGDALLEQVLNDAGSNALVANIDMSKQSEGMVHGCGSVNLHSTDLLSDKNNSSAVNPTVIVTKAQSSHQPNTDDILVSIGEEFSGPSTSGKRTSCSSYESVSKKMKVIGKIQDHVIADADKNVSEFLP